MVVLLRRSLPGPQNEPVAVNRPGIDGLHPDGTGER